MKILRNSIIGCCLCASFWAHAAYKVELTFSNGATRTTDQLVVEEGAVVLAKENLKVPVAQVKQAVFSMDEMLDESECALLLKRGAYEELVARIDNFLEPVKHGLELKSNLDVYIQYKMRALFWLARYDEALSAGQTLEIKQSDYAPLAAAYIALVQLEQGESAAKVTAACVQLGTEFSGVREYVRGRLAMNMRMYEVALQHFSNVLVFNEREQEWVAPATFYEGLIYKKTGFLEQASSVASELRIAYPDGYWGVRADELE